MSDPQKYRTKEEVEEYRKKDPIPTLGSYLRAERGISKAQLDEINANMADEVQEAVQYSIDSPEPSLDILWEDIFAKPFLGVMSPSEGRS